MKAYGVFAGGGAKGVALAGALSAAKSQGVNFVGYGGASVGAVVAYLSAIGYSGEEIYKKILQKDLKDALFEDGGNSLFKSKENLSNIFGVKASIGKINEGGCSRQILNNVKDASISILKFLPAVNNTRKSYKELKKRDVCLGLYDTQHMKQTLIDWTLDIQPELLVDGQVSFKRLHEFLDIDLRVISSNISSRRAAVYSYESTPEFDVITAVCASASYPFLFNPYLDDSGLFIDGGLSSNLPMFMFKNEVQKYNYPLYAFELFKESSAINSDISFFEYGSRLLNTALEASDHVIFGMLKAKKVTIKVPDDIDTLDIDIGKIDVMRLYYSGYLAGEDFFSKDNTVKLLKSSSGDVRNQVLSRYGTKSMFSIVLDAIANDVSQDDKTVRVWLYVPTMRNSIISIATSFSAIDDIYEFKRQDKADAWKAFQLKWNFISSSYSDEAQYKTRVSVPVFLENDIINSKISDESSNNHSSTKETVVGVLVFDMDIDPDLCWWLDNDVENGRLVMHNDFEQHFISRWQAVLSRLLSNVSY